MQEATFKVPRSDADLEKRQDNTRASILPWRRKLADDDAPVEFVPTEHVLVTAVTLGARHAHQRLASLPFAIEDRLAQPVEKAHVALGPRLGENVYLAAAVDEAWMEAWLSAPREDGRDDFRLVPDIFRLAVPPEGTWHIATLGERVIVRLPDATGFATQTRLLASFHAAAGNPGLVLCGVDGPLPHLPFLRLAEPDGWNSPSVLFDLRQGKFAAHQPKVDGIFLKLARTACIGLIALTALGAIDGYVLTHQAAREESALAAQVEAREPGAMTGNEVTEVIERMAAPAGETDTFLTILSTAGESWPLDQTVQLRELEFSAAGNNLELLVEAGSIAELEGFAGGLETAGLEAEVGASTAIPGGAEGRIRIGASGARP